MRDGVFAEQVVDLFSRTLGQASSAGPWLTVASFVNPHDIAFAGGLYEVLLGFQPSDDTVPEIPEAPSQSPTPSPVGPACQERFKRDLWPSDDRGATLPTWPTAVSTTTCSRWSIRPSGGSWTRWPSSGMADETIVVFTSDHGDLLGAHGGLQQKWCNAFDEATRVPMIVNGPGVAPVAGGIATPTSHVDLIPTLMGLAGIDAERAFAGVAADHSEAHSLPRPRLEQLAHRQRLGRVGRGADLLHDRRRTSPAASTRTTSSLARRSNRSRTRASSSR